MALPFWSFPQVKVCVVFLLFLLCHHSCFIESSGSKIPSNNRSFHATFNKKNGSSSDELALLSFKSLITHDPYGGLASWGNYSLHFCQWHGVTCSKHKDQLMVVALDLQDLDMSGSISPSLGNLTYLQRLNLSENLLYGIIPKELGLLSNLQDLDLSFNLLEGTLPQEIGILHNLELFDLTDNQISGTIPSSLGNLSFLWIFSLERNQFVGCIPTVFQNLTSLTILSLSKNHFHGHLPPFLGSLLSLTKIFLAFNNLTGSIPTSLGNLHSLDTLAVGFNNLEGFVPDSIWNLSSLQYLQVQENNLHGLISPNIGQTLPNLVYLLLHQNQFHGPIPTSLSNCSSLKKIDLSENAFSGKVPTNLGALKSLSTLDLYSNMLEARDSTDWAFLESMKNCTNLKILLLYDNEFSGLLPNSIANLSTSLSILCLAGSRLSGTIPAEIKNLVGLSWLALGEMRLTGIIPLTMGSLPSLQILDLRSNELYGEIPHTLGNLTQLNELHLDHNNLSGHIPPSLGRCNKLNFLNFENNMLIGTIPDEITSLFSLISIFLSNNFLIGSLPANFGRLINVEELDVSNNKLSGKIPSSLGQCTSLQYLYMDNNFFEGTIPLSLESLRGLQEIDLSHNKLVGEIPKYLETFSLQYLNLSFNQLEGEVPKSGIFANASAFSVFGNEQLCGGIPKLNLPACFNQPTRKGRSQLVVVVTVASVVMFFIILIVILISSRNKLGKLSPSIWRLGKEQHIKISYAELLKATNGFSPENLIGAGSFGSVYKGIMDSNDNNIVAVKVLNLQQRGASKSFEAECKALRSARHRNLVKVLTTCSSIDYGGNNFKALVFEFMHNGSLDKWLHTQLNGDSSNQTYLNLIQRLNIAVDVANALDYLHNQGSMQIIHCDLKPSNVLLDEDMVAHVGDFGLAKLVTDATIESAQILTESVALKGTIGYVAPEYGMANQVSTRGDVYSFGILLLEIFTGRRPTDGIFIESHSLHQFVQMALPKQVLSILDPKMFSLQGNEVVGHEIQHINNISKHELECIVSVLNVGLLCSKESPLERIQIEQASKELNVIKDVFNKVEQARHT